jgi:hypothetical protein
VHCTVPSEYKKKLIEPHAQAQIFRVDGAWGRRRVERYTTLLDVSDIGG